MDMIRIFKSEHDANKTLDIMKLMFQWFAYVEFDPVAKDWILFQEYHDQTEKLVNALKLESIAISLGRNEAKAKELQAFLKSNNSVRIIGDIVSCENDFMVWVI